MCRIFGAINDNSISEIKLLRASREMLSGGPDRQTNTIGEGWAVGANRLAIQGLTGGLQPFRLNNHICVFNGEVYNHRTLRAELVEKGYCFTDSCDGNVILPLYQEYGADFVQHIEGMFAIAILELGPDGQCRSAFLAADHSAMKTLFYVEQEGGLYFASSLSALQILAPRKFSMREGYVHEVVTRQAVWGPNTVYDGVQVLGAGETLRYDVASGKLHLGLYQHSFQSVQVSGLDDAADRFDALIQAEIASMANVDVDYCAVLSGGLDSSYITALLKKNKDHLDAFHIGYDGNWPGDESAFAHQVADAHDVKLHDIKVNTADIPAYIAEYIQHLDQPNYAPHCLSTYFLFKEIGDHGYKVAFTGEGADELFCGYGRLIQAATSQNDDWFETFYSRYGVAAFQGGQYLKADYYADVMRGYGAPAIADKAGRSRAQNVLDYDSTKRFPYYILRRVDSLSMANSVEVRMPFLQPRIIDFARNLPDELLYSQGVGKQCVLRAGEKYLPREVIHRKKQPFTFPIQLMIAANRHLRDYVFDTIFAHGSIADAYFDIPRIQAFKDRSLNDEETSVLWALLVLQEWHNARSNT